MIVCFGNSKSKIKIYRYKNLSKNTCIVVPRYENNTPLSKKNINIKHTNTIRTDENGIKNGVKF